MLAALSLASRESLTKLNGKRLWFKQYLITGKITCNINDPKGVCYSFGPTLQFGVLIRSNAAVGSTVQPPCLLYPQFPSAKTHRSVLRRGASGCWSTYILLKRDGCFSPHTRVVLYLLRKKKNPVSCLTWGVLGGFNEHRFNWHIFKWSFDLRRTVALNVWTQAEGEINKKGTHQRVLTVSVSPEVSSVSGLTAGRPWCRWCCGVRTPQARRRERTNGGVELCGLRERKTQWAISPRQGLSWLLQKLHALIGPEERGGRRKMRPHWRMKRRQTHWLDTLLIHRQKKTVFMRHV